MKLMTTLLLLALVALPASRAYAASGHAHVHGAATLEVAVDGDRLMLEFSSPLDNLLGFERAPRDDKEKEAVRRLKQQLERAELLFVPTPEAGCTRESARMEAPVLTGGKPDAAGHAALTAELAFRCQRVQALSGLEAKVFDAFPRLTRLDVQVAGTRKQVAARLTPKNRRIAW